MVGDMTASEMLDEPELCDASMQLKHGKDFYFESIGFLYRSIDVVTGCKSDSYRSSARFMRGMLHLQINWSE